MRRTPALVLLLVLGLVALGPPAGATFPGRNGKIVYSRDGKVHVMRPDGTGEHRLSLGPRHVAPSPPTGNRADLLSRLT